MLAAAVEDALVVVDSILVPLVEPVLVVEVLVVDPTVVPKELAIVLKTVLNVLDMELIVGFDGVDVGTVFSVVVTVESADLVTFPSTVVVVLVEPPFVVVVPAGVVGLGGKVEAGVGFPFCN